MRNVPILFLSGVDTSTQTGAAVFVGQGISGSFVSSFDDLSAAGTVKVQGSNDLPVGDPISFIPTNWADITGATSTIASGAGPAITLQTISFQYLRVIYTSASGGSSKVTVNGSILMV